MRVVQVGLEYVPKSGGTATAISDFGRALQASLISFTAPKTMRSISSKDQDVMHVPTHAGLLGKYYAWSRSYLKQSAAVMLQGADLIVCHMLYRYHIQWASGLAIRAHVPYWVVPHGSLDPYIFTYRQLQKRSWLCLLGLNTLRRASRIIFATEREKQKAQSYVSSSNSVVIHWPIELVDTSRKLESRARVRRQHRIPEDARLLLYFGRLHDAKQPLQTILAFGRCNQPNTHLLMIGPDDTFTRAELEHFCFMQDISNVHIIGPVYGDCRYAYYMASDAYISLSHKENFGYSVADALACACPVILSPGIDLTPELQSAECGWLLDSTDLATVVEALNEFTQGNPAALVEMGLRGQRWARVELSRERFEQQLRQLATESIAERAIG